MDLGSDGTGAALIMVAVGGSRQRASKRPPEPSDHFFRIGGRDVFIHAVSRMADTSRRVLKTVGWPPDEVDCVIAHQANLRILHAVCDRMGISRGRAVVHVDQVGNTSVRANAGTDADTTN